MVLYMGVCVSSFCRCSPLARPSPLLLLRASAAVDITQNIDTQSAIQGKDKQPVKKEPLPAGIFLTRVLVFNKQVPPLQISYYFLTYVVFVVSPNFLHTAPHNTGDASPCFSSTFSSLASQLLAETGDFCKAVKNR